MSEPTTDILTLSPAEAGARLAEMAAKFRQPAAPAEPKSAADADARLNELRGDKKWGEKFLNGDAATLKEHAALAKLASGPDRFNAVVDGKLEPSPFEVTHGADLSIGKLLDAATGLRELGIRDEVIKEAMNGATISQREHDSVKNLKATWLGDREWTAKYLKGGAAEKRQMALANIVLTHEIDLSLK